MFDFHFSQREWLEIILEVAICWAVIVMLVMALSRGVVRFRLWRKLAFAYLLGFFVFGTLGVWGEMTGFLLEGFRPAIAGQTADSFLVYGVAWPVWLPFLILILWRG